MSDRSEIHVNLFKSAELDLAKDEKNFLDEVDRSHKDQWAEATSTIFSAKILMKSANILRDAINENTSAMIHSNEVIKINTLATQEYTRRLAEWTKWLAIATIVLAIFALAKFFL